MAVPRSSSIVRPCIDDATRNGMPAPLLACRQLIAGVAAIHPAIAIAGPGTAAFGIRSTPRQWLKWGALPSGGVDPIAAVDQSYSAS